ncbi:hypothetical protein HK405_003725 [Cladochytrium tenue]|nr:hypothetical protein HK405_003725 [Cladochytrium tenue]
MPPAPPPCTSLPSRGGWQPPDTRSGGGSGSHATAARAGYHRRRPPLLDESRATYLPLSEGGGRRRTALAAVMPPPPLERARSRSRSRRPVANATSDPDGGVYPWWWGGMDEDILKEGDGDLGFSSTRSAKAKGGRKTKRTSEADTVAKARLRTATVDESTQTPEIPGQDLSPPSSSLDGSPRLESSPPPGPRVRHATVQTDELQSRLARDLARLSTLPPPSSSPPHLKGFVVRRERSRSRSGEGAGAGAGAGLAGTLGTPNAAATSSGKRKDGGPAPARQPSKAVGGARVLASPSPFTPGARTPPPPPPRLSPASRSSRPALRGSAPGEAWIISHEGTVRRRGTRTTARAGCPPDVTARTSSDSLQPPPLVAVVPRRPLVDIVREFLSGPVMRALDLTVLDDDGDSEDGDDHGGGGGGGHSVGADEAGDGGVWRGPRQGSGEWWEEDQEEWVGTGGGVPSGRHGTRTEAEVLLHPAA